jgi:hypothetical protein
VEFTDVEQAQSDLWNCRASPHPAAMRGAPAGAESRLHGSWTTGGRWDHPRGCGEGSGPQVGVVAEGDYRCGCKRAAWPEAAAMPPPRPCPRERGTRRRGASRSGGTAHRGSTGGRVCV